MYPAKSMLPFPSGTPYSMSAQKKKKDWNRVLQLVRLTARAEIRSSQLLQGNLQFIYSTVANHSLLLISILPYISYPTPWSNCPFFLVAVSTRLLGLLVSSCGMPRRLCQLQTQLLRLFGLDGALTALGHVLRLDAHDACAGTGEEPKSRGKADLKSEKSENLGIVSKVGNNQQLPYFHGCWLDFVPWKHPGFCDDFCDRHQSQSSEPQRASTPAAAVLHVVVELGLEVADQGVHILPHSNVIRWLENKRCSYAGFPQNISKWPFIQFQDSWDVNPGFRKHLSLGIMSFYQKPESARPNHSASWIWSWIGHWILRPAPIRSD